MLSLCERVSCLKCNRIGTFEVLYTYLQQIYNIISIEDKYFVYCPEWCILLFSQSANKLWIYKYLLKKKKKNIFHLIYKYDGTNPFLGFKMAKQYFYFSWKASYLTYLVIIIIFLHINYLTTQVVPLIKKLKWFIFHLILLIDHEKL